MLLLIYIPLLTNLKMYTLFTASNSQYNIIIAINNIIINYYCLNLLIIII